MQKTAKPVYIEPSKNGKISTAGRQQIATINGKPNIPARTNDWGVPPTPIQIGSFSCKGRG